MAKMRLALLATVILMVGCTVKIGSMPDTLALQSQLRQHVSTKGDVLRVLGPPRGYGMGRLPDFPDPRVTWFYEYVESDGTNIELKMLLVFFDGERYSGHLWFSSLEKLEVIR